MKLKVLLPTEVLVDQEVAKVVAEAENGSFCLLERHVDFVATLPPGIVSFMDSGGKETFLAIDEGVLIKCGPEVLVSTRNAMRGPDLGQLKHAVEDQFRRLDEREKTTRSAVAKLEAGFARKFLDMEE